MLPEFSMVKPFHYSTPLTLLVTGVLTSLLTLPVAAADLKQQRHDYAAAHEALEHGNLTRYRQLLAGLEDYPLTPYLHLDYIEANLHSLPEAEIVGFLTRYPNLPGAERLRNEWLDILAGHGRWQDYIDHYVPPNDNRLRCLYLIARMKTGQTEGLLEDIVTMWRVGYSQDEACDPAFEKLYVSDHFNNELIWQRIRLAMANDETGLASYLAKKLPAAERGVAERWLEIRRHPDAGTRNPQLADTVIGREIVLDGLRQLARQNMDTAQVRWKQLQQRYSFTQTEIQAMQRDLAVIAAGEEHPDAARLLAAVDAAAIDSTVFIYRLRHDINHGHWQQLRDWTAGAPPADVRETQWRYWHARALEQTDDLEGARTVYQQLATRRDFYGFLAADRLGIGYQMNHTPTSLGEVELDRIAQIPGVRRAFEFLALGEQYDARREWYHLLNHLDAHEMRGAAKLAAAHNWYSPAIAAMGRAHAYDDLDVRFPLLYRDTLSEYARKRGLDLAWVYGLIRSESAFWETARSPAGALGLMQVMPQTGEHTAAKLGMRNFNSRMLLQAQYNIPIGSQYLKMMYHDFDDNMILATAAYNAGPSRVKSWLPKSGCVEPDIWIENIPFYETRGYVKRVLEYTSVYDWRLQGDHTRITARMDPVTPLQPSNSLSSNLRCNLSTLTMQP